MKRFFVLLAAACFLSLSSSASAGIILGAGGVGGSPPTDWNGAPGFGIEVSEDGDPIPIFPDPNGPAWVKQFEISLINGINTNDIIPIWEFLNVVVGPPGPIEIADWHETILPGGDSADFIWGPGTIDIDAEGPIAGTLSANN